MSGISRRKLLTGGLAAAAGLSGLSVAARLAARYGLVPPDAGGLYGPGETLTFAAHRLLVGDTPAREFARHMISAKPFANETAPKNEAFLKLQDAGFAAWKLEVGGMVDRPKSFSLADLRALPRRSHITQVACEEGWSYIAEWAGAPLSDVLAAVGMKPGARYVAYYSFESGWWETIDMAEAMHPQTLVTWEMNSADLPVEFGGPLRLRVPRQLGYKSLKYLTRIDVVDSVAHLGKGVGGGAAESGYAWYAGI
jgi:DMSO/TMAO reductase YedYZ molybdopterin-dependent catalytic subunit